MLYGELKPVNSILGWNDNFEVIDTILPGMYLDLQSNLWFMNL